MRPPRSSNDHDVTRPRQKWRGAGPSVRGGDNSALVQKKKFFQIFLIFAKIDKKVKKSQKKVTGRNPGPLPGPKYIHIYRQCWGALF